MNLFAEAGHIATEESCTERWCCDDPGVCFRCAFCGYKFKPGDWWRAIYTNDLPKAGGNPLVCKDCASNHTTAEIRVMWIAKWAEVRKFREDPQYWWFNRSKGVRL